MGQAFLTAMYVDQRRSSCRSLSARRCQPDFGTDGVPRGERILAIQGDGADVAFDCVAVDPDVAIGQEAPEAVTVFGDVGEDRSEGVLPDGSSSIEGASADISLECIERADEPPTTLVAGVTASRRTVIGPMIRAIDIMAGVSAGCPMLPARQTPLR